MCDMEYDFLLNMENLDIFLEMDKSTVCVSLQCHKTYYFLQTDRQTHGILFVRLKYLLKHRHCNYKSY